MEYELIEIFCTECDLYTVIRLISVCKTFYDKIANSIKFLFDKYKLEYNENLTLRDCYELNNMKVAYENIDLKFNSMREYFHKYATKSVEFYDLCIKYDRYFLLDDLIEREKEHVGKCPMLDYLITGVCIQNNPKLLEHIVRKEYIWYDKEDINDKAKDILNHYIETNNVEMVGVLLGGYEYDCDDESIFCNNQSYFYCSSKEMYMLLKGYNIYYAHNGTYNVCTTDIFNIITEGDNKDLMTDCILKYSDDDERKTLIYTFLWLDKMEDQKILDYINENGFGGFAIHRCVIKDMHRNKDCLKNYCKYGNGKDKFLLLNQCRGESNETIEVVLDYLFEYGDADKHLGENYFLIKRSRKDVLYDLIDKSK